MIGSRGLALAVGVLIVASLVTRPALAQTPSPPVPAPADDQATRRAEQLRGLLLTEADVPSGLRINPQMSGPRTTNESIGYQMVFSASQRPPDGGILGVSSLLAAVGEQVTRTPGGLDAATDGAKGAVLFGTAPPRDLPPPPVGEEARAFTRLLRDQDGPGALSVVVFHRYGVLGMITIVSAGEQPAVSETLRLAQTVDARLRGEQPTLAPTPPPLLPAPAPPSPSLPASDPPCTTATANPGAFRITRPDSLLAPELAAFAGVWEGISDSGAPQRMIIEQIDSTTATGIRAIGNGSGVRAEVARFAAQVLPGGRLAWDASQGTIRFTYTMGTDLNGIHGRREQGTTITTIQLSRCSWQ